MSSTYDSSHGEVRTDGRHLPTSVMFESKMKSYREWFQEYMDQDADFLDQDSDIIRAVDSDELHADFIEQRIRDSGPESSVTNGFCAKCQNTFNNWPTPGDSSIHEHESNSDADEDVWEFAVAWSRTTFELECSTRQGCRFCTFLLQRLKDNKVLDTYRKIEARLYNLNESAMPSLSIQDWGNDSSQLLWLNLPGKICTHCNFGIAQMMTFYSHVLPPSANCYDEPTDVFDIASKWLSTCSGGHELCRSKDNGALPSRLISITTESAHLVQTSGLHKRPQYATLSHCWGSQQLTTLTTENFDLFLKRLPVQHLPRTFKDALKITRRLGLDFLWIDSLCIIQDDENDWQKEAALMSSVYGGSFINIAASSARDSSQGCFRKPRYFSGGLRARTKEGSRQRVRDFRSSDVYGISTLRTHLATRAWTLQEKLLPSRTIHFGNRGAFWECKTTIASEYLLDGFPGLVEPQLVCKRGKLEHMWHQIVNIYSAANLTFGRDKLVALSGVARLAHSDTSGEYLAGLWRNRIEEQLCWYRCDSVPCVRPPWRAPTWSWASIDGKVTLPVRQKGLLENMYAHVLDASTRYEYDSFGQVTSGVIRLACSTMVTGNLVHSEKSNELKSNKETRIWLLSGNEEHRFPIRMDCMPLGREQEDCPIYLLPILGGPTGSSTKAEGKDIVMEHIIHGLAIQRTGVPRGEFSRVGSFSLNNEEDLYDSFLDALKTYGRAAAEEACDETTRHAQYPDECYIITLV